MSQRIDTILALLTIVELETRPDATLEVITEQRNSANRELAARADHAEQTIRDTYREQLRPYVDGVEAFDLLLHAWRTTGDGRLAAVLQNRANPGDCDRDRIDEFFGGSVHGETGSEQEADSMGQRSGEIDYRVLVWRQLHRRRAQLRVRDALLSRYGKRCLVTECEVQEVLAAAHIRTHARADDNRPENGLLLRSDIHTLFDRNLLGIEPKELRVELHPTLLKEYGRFAGTTLRCWNHRPSEEALEERYARFRQRLLQPA
jgi:hypothetical protein